MGLAATSRIKGRSLSYSKAWKVIQVKPDLRLRGYRKRRGRRAHGARMKAVHEYSIDGLREITQSQTILIWGIQPDLNQRFWRGWPSGVGEGRIDNWALEIQNM